MSRSRAIVALGLAFVLALGACGDPAGGPAGTSGSSKVYIRAEVPSFRFEDQDGRPFGRDALRGKVWVADFFFVRCGGPCPKMTAAMKALQDRTGDRPDLHFASITVTPDHDTAEDLKTYATRFGADLGRWHFLRGEVADTRTVLKGFMVGVPDQPMDHSTKFILVDREGFIRAYYDGLDPAEHDRLIADADRLLAGAPL